MIMKKDQQLSFDNISDPNYKGRLKVLKFNIFFKESPSKSILISLTKKEIQHKINNELQRKLFFLNSQTSQILALKQNRYINKIKNERLVRRLGLSYEKTIKKQQSTNDLIIQGNSRLSTFQDEIEPDYEAQPYLQTFDFVKQTQKNNLRQKDKTQTQTKEKGSPQLKPNNELPQLQLQLYQEDIYAQGIQYSPTKLFSVRSNVPRNEIYKSIQLQSKVNSFHTIVTHNQEQQFIKPKYQKPIFQPDNYQQNQLTKKQQLELKKYPQFQKEIVIAQDKSIILNAKRWCVSLRKPYQKTYRVIESSNLHQKSEIASLTKIMTLYTTLHLTESLQVPLKMIKIKLPSTLQEIEGTSSSLFGSEILTIQDILYGLMLPSGNDAALVVAISVGLLMKWKQQRQRKWASIVVRGTLIDLQYEREQGIEYNNLIENFILHMNMHASTLGMKGSKFTSVHGLEDQTNLSTVYDIGLLVEHCMIYPIFQEIINCQEYECISYDKQGYQVGLHKWVNTNKLLRKGWKGVKTGFTKTAGACFCGYWVEESYHIILTLLGCDTLQTRWKDATALLDYVKQNNFFN